MTINEALINTRQSLKENEIPDPEMDSLLLLSAVTGLERLELCLQKKRELTPEQEQRLASLLLSRTQRKPLQYLLGEQWFYGRRFQVDDQVLIPRQETESLCQLGIEYLHSLNSASVLDLCTGSGAIAVTIAKECPHVQTSAADLSKTALVRARKNAEAHQAEIVFYQGDLFDAVPQGMQFDLILSNPPYIPSTECHELQSEVMYEPAMALDGGLDGLDFYRRIARSSPAYMKNGSVLMVEIGCQQALDVSALFTDAGFAEVTVHKDLYGLDRIVTGRRNHV